MKPKKTTLGVSVKVRNEYSDYDYLHKLNSSELKWLIQFHQEYLNCNLQVKPSIHTTKEQISDIYSMNNSKNRCAFSVCKANRMLFYSLEIGSKSWKRGNNIDGYSREEVLNIIIDMKKLYENKEQISYAGIASKITRYEKDMK